MFYKTIAKYYDHIFPQNPMQVKCIENHKAIQEDEVILDIGCATGSLTALIYEKTSKVQGLDLNQSLLTLAAHKYPQIDFCHKNMLDIPTMGFQTFDRIVSFGNTLVHLKDLHEVTTFFKGVYYCLKDKGQFTVQIINYNRIYKDNIQSLPLIDNDTIRFQRDYVNLASHVVFNTELLVKASQETLTNSIDLLNLTQEDIQKSLTDIGFRDLEFYGNLNCQPLSDQSVPLIFTCYK